ncbi:MAG: HAMP domain-containing histidine kinase [Lachnospiraceae bacterium]|nr:HAMP domain-containing histidine kinase [Lachnospiraceae bacterium]MCM1231362.1 HAMP domain-containing histidine kinase [Ruminococcus flavefaciens]
MTYIMTTWFISEIIMFIIITLFVHLYINQSVELDIRSSLSRQVSSLSEAIVSNNGVLSVDESKIEKKYPDMYIAIVDSNGNVIWGSAPDGVSIDTKRSMAPAKVTAGKISYYYIDRDIKYTMSDNGFVRAYVSEEDILGNYIPLRVISYTGMAVVFVGLTMVMLYALRRFRRSVKTMEMSVEKIGTSQMFDERMDENGHYKEINALIEANNRMIDRMNEIFESQEQFSSDVAHELRTPISVIKAQSQYALNNMELSDEERKSFEVILKQAQKMQNLVITLLELSRLESGNGENMQEYIDLTEIVSAVCEAEQYRLPDCKIRFEVTDSGISETLGNINLVTIAVTNLISNAVKFSSDDSVIEVAIGEKDGFVFVSVKDSGIGMTEEEQKKVLTRFFKSDSSRNSSGYGLGMPIALKIAKKHGGTIEIESELGKGSSFTLYLAKNK